MSHDKQVTSDFNQYSRFTLFGLMSLLVIVLIRTAWISDDAYITMRTVDNFTHGYGLVYNIGERVQTYTHPLWLFVLSGVYLVAHQAYITLLLCSIVFSLAAAIILVQRIATTPVVGLLVTTILLFSKAFIDYSTSGLENPLSYLLIVVFMGLYLTASASPRKLLVLSLIAALGALNRLDLLLIFLPGVAFTMVEIWQSKLSRRKTAILIGALGFLPLLAWLIFSIIYYGFAFPNTAYAKLNTGISAGMLYRQGISYYLSLLSFDPLTLFVIGWGVISALFSRNNRQLTVALSVGLYLAYIVYIGGDFMEGRFFTIPFLCAVVLLCRSEAMVDGNSLLLPLGLVLMIGLTTPYPSLFSAGDYGHNRNDLIDVRGVADERAKYYFATGLLQACRECSLPDHPWVKDGLNARRDKVQVAVKDSIGFFGFYAGPAVYVSDTYGIADPFLARLPISDLNGWRVGHYIRSLPAGYQETLDTGVNQIQDPGLAEFYNHLSLITRGNLFDAQRLITIWKMNTGQYNDLISRTH